MSGLPCRLAGILVMAALMMVPCRAPVAPEAQVEDVFKTLRRGHPRLYFTKRDFAAVRRQVATDPLVRAWHARLREQARRMLREPTAAHKLIGPRMLSQSRAALRRISTLAGLYRLDADRDFAERARSQLGRVPWAGGYSFAHHGPVLRLTDRSRLHDGDKLRVSLYHPVVIHNEQVACCLSEPRVYAILEDQVKRVNDLLHPRTFFLSHDELRVANWCKACQDRHQTPGALLADNLRRCVTIIRKISPDAQIVVWSDMFDPHHNAVKDYYLVNGPLTGSWEGLPRDVIVANWNSGQGAESLKWFARRGNPQVVAGYYDAGPENFRRWDAAARGVPGIRGFLYTTWQQRYGDLEAYGKLLQGKR